MNQGAPVSTNAGFQAILDAARDRKGARGVDTMIVTGHLAQMRLFMLRQGIEFYPRQDTYGFRKAFLSKIVEENEVDARLEGVVDEFLSAGQGLWFFRPVRDTYRIMWFSRENYRAYYDALEEIEEVDLVYSYQVRQEGTGALAPTAANGAQLKYVRLQVKRDRIIETLSDTKPSLDAPQPALSANQRTTRNSLGFIPAVEAFNNMRSSGMEATGDFNIFENHILAHNDLITNIRENIFFYGNPTLVSSRPKHELTERAGGEEPRRPTIASNAGFGSAANPSTRFAMTSGNDPAGGNRRMRVPRIMHNLEPNDRVGYVTPNAVSGDQNLYARQYREEIRAALGGVDELGISSGATAYEIKSLFGRAATTATRKCRGLLTYGLCKLLALMIYHEERVFRESFSSAINLAPPPAPIREEIEGGDEAYYAAVADHERVYQEYRSLLDEKIQEAIESREFPKGVVGLIPDGDRRVEWRWRGPVFEESSEDLLNASIVVRNLQELGVNSIEALRYLFPSKTDEERSAMLNGYPFRMAAATQSSIGTYLSLINTMRQIPHPQAPDLSLLADARLDLVPFLYRTFDYLKRELTYAGQYGDAAGSSEPAELNPIERARANAGLDVAAGGADEPDFIPDGAPGGGPSGNAPGAGGGSLAAGVPEPGRQFERDALIPGPGTLLASDPTGARLPGLLPFTGNRLLGGIGDADFAAPSNAGLFADIAADVARRPGADERPGRARRRRVSRSGQR
jgi:hypothetical protein